MFKTSVSNFGNSNFGFVSNFDIRISDFLLHNSSRKQLPLQINGLFDKICLLPLRLMIGAHEHLRDETHEDKLDAEEEEKHRQKQERILVGEGASAVFLDDNLDGREHTEHTENGADASEEVAGLRCVTRKELYGQKIHQDLEDTHQTVF